MLASQLLALLLDVERLPGRYALAQREPALLFEHALTVLRLAAGRPIDGLEAMAPAQQEELRRTARFFVRAALLRHGADHYTVLGLTPDADGEQLREHYRLMIRMTHPDRVLHGEHWPADSAARINLANDVLTSAVRRREYDEKLKGAEPTAAARPTKAGPQHARARQKKAGGMSKRAKAVLATLGALICVTGLVVLNATESGSLSARQRTVADDTVGYAEGGFSVFRQSAPKDPPTPLAQPAGSAQMVAQGTDRLPAQAPSALPGREPVADLAHELLPLPVVVPAVAGATSARGTMDDQALVPETSPAQRGATLQLTRQMIIQKDEPTPPPTQVQMAKAEPTDAAPAPAAGRPTVQAVHPLMTNVLASMPAGRGENLAQWIAPDWRSRSGNQAFVTQYNQWLGKQRVREVSNVSLTTQPQGDTLVVDGMVQLGLVPSLDGESTRMLRLRAYFQLQDGQAVLTQLTASEPP